MPEIPRFAIGLVGLAIVLVGAQQVSAEWHIYDGHSYTISQAPGTWPDAEAEAVRDSQRAEVLLTSGLGVEFGL